MKESYALLIVFIVMLIIILTALRYDLRLVNIDHRLKVLRDERGGYTTKHHTPPHLAAHNTTTLPTPRHTT